MLNATGVFRIQKKTVSKPLNCHYSQISGNLTDFFFVFHKNVCKGFENHKILERCEGKNVNLEKR